MPSVRRPLKVALKKKNRQSRGRIMTFVSPEADVLLGPITHLPPPVGMTGRIGSRLRGVGLAVPET